MINKIKARQLYILLYVSIKTVESFRKKIVGFKDFFQGLCKMILQHFSRKIEFSRTFQERPLYPSTFQACGTSDPYRPHI